MLIKAQYIQRESFWKLVTLNITWWLFYLFLRRIFIIQLLLQNEHLGTAANDKGSWIHWYFHIILNLSYCCRAYLYQYA